MSRVRINSHDLAIEPSVTAPHFCIEKDLNPVTNVEIVSHIPLCAAARPKCDTQAGHNHNPAGYCPLDVTRHKTAWQDVDSLQEEYSSCKDE